MRRTKIVATLGPSLDDPEILKQIMQSGASVFRANFSHGTTETHQKRIQSVRRIAHALGIEVAIIADLQGPKIRIAKFKNNIVHLQTGARFILDANLGQEAGTVEQVGIDYKALPQDVHIGDHLLLDDGRVVLQVTQVQGSQIHTTILIGGDLTNNKGINRQGGGLSAPVLTEKDRADLLTAVKLEVDYVAISFPRNAQDIQQALQLLQEAGSDAGVIAKIERAEAIEEHTLDAMIQASAAVMVARGDLGVEIGDAALPAAQKQIILRATALNKAVITATQMMESMIHNPIPTRAEVFDVANAVLDGTDAVMLSAETATGEFPALVIETTSRICETAEKQPAAITSTHRMESRFQTDDEAIAMAAMYIANHMNIQAIITITESGYTPLLMSRIRSAIPIYALSRHRATRRKVALYRGVYSVPFDVTQLARQEINKEAVQCLKEKNIIKAGDHVLITKGSAIGISGQTNSMKIYIVD